MQEESLRRPLQVEVGATPYSFEGDRHVDNRVKARAIAMVDGLITNRVSPAEFVGYLSKPGHQEILCSSPSGEGSDYRIRYLGRQIWLTRRNTEGNHKPSAVLVSDDGDVIYRHPNQDDEADRGPGSRLFSPEGRHNVFRAWLTAADALQTNHLDIRSLYNELILTFGIKYNVSPSSIDGIVHKLGEDLFRGQGILAKNSGRLSRTRFLQALIGLTIPGALAACAPAHPPSTIIPSTPDRRTQDDISRYYPELAGLRIYGRGAFTTIVTPEVRWYNFTPNQFDAKVARAVIVYFETLFPQQGVPSFFIYQGKRVLYTAQQRDKSPEKVLFIIPDNAPHSLGVFASSLLNEPDSPAGTYLDDNKARATYVRYRPNPNEPIFTTAVDFTNVAFDIEAAQMSIMTQAVNFNLTVLSQEVLANSLARMLAAKQRGWNYQRLLEYAAKSSFFGVPMIILSEADWNKMPVVGKVISSKP